MVTLTSCPKEDIVNQLSGFAQLMDILPPQAPNELVDFIRQQYGALKPEVLGRALNQWAGGESQILKPKRLNGYFIAQAMSLYIQGQRSVAHSSLVPEVEQTAREYSPQEKDDIFTEAYYIHKEQYLNRYIKREPNIIIIWPSFRHQYEFILKKGWMTKDEFTPEQAAKKGAEIRGEHVQTEKRFHAMMSAAKSSYRSQILEWEWDLIGYVALHFHKKLSNEKVG